MWPVLDDEARFRAAFQRHYDSLLAYALRRINSRDDAEEVVASAFATAWRRIDAMPEEPETVIWLYRVVWRTLANQRRSNFRRGRLISRVGGLRPDEEHPVRDAAADIAGERLATALDRLSRNEREVLRLVAWEELSYAEAASVLGCSPNAFAIRLHRARASLRAELIRSESSDSAEVGRDE